MADISRAKIAIVDYGLGNLFSVKHAWEHVGVQATITGTLHEIRSADAVVLPGVGAFGNAMESIESLDLVYPLRDMAESGKPLIGICLGMQLLMTESFEFGRHRGLGIIEGSVVRFEQPVRVLEDPNSSSLKSLKVPQVGWNRISRCNSGKEQIGSDNLHLDPWRNSPLAGLVNGEFMYFVHSYYAKPKDSTAVLSESQYGDINFCSSLRHRNIFACQFHPERSGPRGLKIYHNLAKWIATLKSEGLDD